MHLRYWGFLVVKLIGAAIGSASSLWMLDRLSGRLSTTMLVILYTMLGVWLLFAYGLFYLAFWDQRYRCRTCLRRLRMPIETGSWSCMLQLGRPKMEYICPYGHGKLNVEELKIAGTVPPEWTEQGDIWAELFPTTHGVSKEPTDHDQ